ncbi:hypothetical protein ACFLSK_00635 [Chloroflexota bacterium]
MSLDLPDSVNRIFHDVEVLSGKSVKLIEKRDLDTYASVKIARKSMQDHLMFYKPEHHGFLNHLIAHECGHILRIYGVAPEDRLIPFTNDDFKMKGLKDIEPEIQQLSKLIPFKQLVQISNMWYAGTIKQLTNFPSDIMIEKWIYDEYPDLRDYQSKYLKKQYDEAVQGLSAQVEKMTPRKILKASNGLNYAFYQILGAHFQDNYYVRRYDKSAYVSVGDELALSQRKSENNYKGDVETVNRWAEVLKVSHWFSWRDFEDVPDNYLNTFS